MPSRCCYGKRLPFIDKLSNSSCVILLGKVAKLRTYEFDLHRTSSWSCATCRPQNALVDKASISHVMQSDVSGAPMRAKPVSLRGLKKSVNHTMCDTGSTHSMVAL